MPGSRRRTWLAFLVTYGLVFATMAGWWWLMATAAVTSGPILTVLIAYIAPILAVVAIVGWAQRRSGV